MQHTPNDFGRLRESWSNPFAGEDGNETGDLSMDEFCDMIVKMKVAFLEYGYTSRPGSLAVSLKT